MVHENIRPLIDDLGRVKAQLADLARREKELKEQIVELGEGSHEGDLFRATVSFSERETLDMEAVREKLTSQFIRAHTRTTPVTTVRVAARVQAKEYV
jgi:hypothetical protein